MFAQRLRTTAHTCASISVSLLDGASSFLRGLALVARAGCSAPGSPKILRELSLTPVAAGWVASTAGLMWLACIPMRRWGWCDPTLADLTCAASWVVIELGRPFVGWVSPHWFFHVLATRDEALAESVREKPIVNGLKQTVRKWLVALCGCAAAAAILAVTWPVVVPMLAALAASVAVSVPIVIGASVAVLAAAALLGGSAYVFALLRPVLKIFEFDPVLGLVAVVALTLQLLSVGSITTTIKGAAMLYYSCTLVASQMLGQYRERLDAAEWTAFQRRHCWEMFAFGLPIAALVRVSPFAVVAVAQVLHGASAALLADLLAKERGKRAL